MEWVAHCKRVGRGIEALQYLSRYLYRGVISNANLLEDDGQSVTVRYRDSATNQWQTRTLPGEEFVWLPLQHVRPKGFRRARDYGFLHGNAKKLLHVVQWVLRVPISPILPRAPVRLPCPCRHGLMVFTGIRIRETPG